MQMMMIGNNFAIDFPYTNHNGMPLKCFDSHTDDDDDYDAVDVDDDASHSN